MHAEVELCVEPHGADDREVLVRERRVPATELPLDQRLDALTGAQFRAKVMRLGPVA
jgi:hypothetical protein